MSILRKPQSRNFGLKILGYGTDGVGKSVYGLTFPKVVVVDAEGKMGVYENNHERNKNMVALADSSNYYDSLDIIKEIIDKKSCLTYMTDSETYIQDALKVASMETEEARAIKKGGDPTDQGVSQRGWGKIGLNIARTRMLRAKASSDGITIYNTAHLKDIMQKVGQEQVKVGEMPNIKNGCKHEYDVILKFYKEKDLVHSGEYKFKAIVEKDTTETFKVGTIIDNPTYENTYKTYLENNNKLKTVNCNYDKNISDTMDILNDEAKNFDELVSQFEKLFVKIKETVDDGTKKVKDILAKHEVKNYKKQENFHNLKLVVKDLQDLLN